MSDLPPLYYGWTDIPSGLVVGYPISFRYCHLSPGPTHILSALTLVDEFTGEMKGFFQPPAIFWAGSEFDWSTGKLEIIDVDDKVNPELEIVLSVYMQLVEKNAPTSEWRKVFHRLSSWGPEVMEYLVPPKPLTDKQRTVWLGANFYVSGEENEL